MEERFRLAEANGQKISHPLAIPPRIELRQDYAVLFARKHDRFLEVKIDLEDVPRLKQLGHSWTVSKNEYPVSRINNKLHYLHRWLTDCPKGKVVDHINGDKLDARRKSNLRITGMAENTINSNTPHSSNPHRNLFWDKERGKWTAHLSYHGTEYLHKRFPSKETAMQAVRDTLDALGLLRHV